jgi:predicted AlkP superfamily pyrophosphatase or phosphodiesterase
VRTGSPVPYLDIDGEHVVRPDFAGFGLANVAPTILRLLAPAAQVELPSLAEQVLPRSLSDGVKHVVLVVADGFGHLQLEREAELGNAPNIAALIDRPDTAYSAITSVFPTTTVAALGSINSAVTPTAHGLLGYTLYLSEFDMLGEMIRWGPLNRRGSFADPDFSESTGCTPENFFWAETVYQRLHAVGVERTFAVNPMHFGGTALTRMLHQGATYGGYISTSSMQPIVARLIGAGDSPTYVYAYWPTVDTIAHALGPLAPEHGSEVAAFDFQLGRLVQSLRGRDDTLVLVTADHGHVDTAPEFNVYLAEHPELLAMLRVGPSGERRATYLHVLPGRECDVAAYAREHLGDVAACMLRSEAVEAGVFGPGELSERAAERIGEVILFPRRNLGLVAPLEMIDGSVARSPAFRGMHGGLTPEEALVPLLAIRV